MIDDEGVGGSRLWLLSVGAAAGVLQVTGAPGTLISLKPLQLRGEVLHVGEDVRTTRRTIIEEI